LSITYLGSLLLPETRGKGWRFSAVKGISPSFDAADERVWARPVPRPLLRKEGGWIREVSPPRTGDLDIVKRKGGPSEGKGDSGHPYGGKKTFLLSSLGGEGGRGLRARIGLRGKLLARKKRLRGWYRFFFKKREVRGRGAVAGSQ